MYTYRKVQKYLYTNPHTLQKHTHIHIIQCPEQYLNQDSPKYRTGLPIVNAVGVQEGRLGGGGYLLHSSHFNISHLVKLKVCEMFGFPQQGILTL
jgi:hypothetical protein